MAQELPKLNWEKGKPSGSIACLGKYSSLGITEAVHQWLWKMPHHCPLLAHERNSIFKSKQHTFRNPWGPEKNVTTQWWSTGPHITPTTLNTLNTSCSKLNWTEKRESPKPKHEYLVHF